MDARVRGHDNNFGVHLAASHPARSGLHRCDGCNLFYRLSGQANMDTRVRGHDSSMWT